MTKPIRDNAAGQCRNWRRTFEDSQTGVCTYYGNGIGSTGGRYCIACNYPLSRKGGYASGDQE